MKASQLLLFAVVGVAVLWAVKHFNLLSAAPSAGTVTAKQVGGSQVVSSKDDFQTVADDITSIFGTAGKLFGGQAQTSAKTL